MSAAPQTVQIVEPDDGFTLRLARRPDSIVAEARLCANALMTAVRQNGWAVSFSEGGKEHLYFEAWSFLATMYRVTPRVKETRLVQIGDVTGYEATAEAFHVPSSVVISTADSMCLDDEDKWADRPVKEWRTVNGERKKVPTGEFAPVPLFQLRSMAQTRAMAKALRGPFSWIVAMAGYAPRAAEETTGDEPDERKSKPVQQPQQKSPDSNGAGRPITDKQRGRFWAIAKTGGLSNAEATEVYNSFGFQHSEEITTDKYDLVIAALEARAQQKHGGGQ